MDDDNPVFACFHIFIIISKILSNYLESYRGMVLKLPMIRIQFWWKKTQDLFDNPLKFSKKYFPQEKVYFPLLCRFFHIHTQKKNAKLFTLIIQSPSNKETKNNTTIMAKNKKEFFYIFTIICHNFWWVDGGGESIWIFFFSSEKCVAPKISNNQFSLYTSISYAELSPYFLLNVSKMTNAHTSSLLNPTQCATKCVCMCVPKDFDLHFDAKF